MTPSGAGDPGRDEGAPRAPGAPGAPTAGSGGGSRRRLLWGSVAAVVVAAAGLGIGLGVTAGGTGSGGGTAATSTTTGSGTTRGSGTTTTASATSGAAASTTTSSTATGSGGTPGALAAGTYVAGHAGVPHYELTLADADPASLGGTVTFVYQDGSTTPVFTFDGTAIGGQATLHPTGATQGSGAAAEPASSLPATITADLGHGTVDLTGCTGFLHFAHKPSDCRFTYAAGGTG